MKQTVISLIFFTIVFLSDFTFGGGIQEKFENSEKLVYAVSFNGMPSGCIEWEYLGREEIVGKEADVLAVNSDTRILRLFNLTSNEKVFLDVETHLPLRVERNIVFFGKKKFIEEVYNQDEGYVKITKKDSKGEENIFYQKKPIHNILALLYFFPENIDLKKGEWKTFNLPTREVRIKMVSQRILTVGKEKKNTYFLTGKGAKKFNLWLDEKDRMPLRLEFILPIGKVTIVRRILKESKKDTELSD